MPNVTDRYSNLIRTLKEISTLDSAASLLSWDEQTFMPRKGAELRANQASLLARMSHEKFTDRWLGELLRELEGGELTREQYSDSAVNIRWTRRLYDRATKVPPKLVEELSRTAVLAHEAWVGARKKADYKGFQPWLQKTLDLKREEAKCVGYKGHIYNALLDPFEPDETAENLTQVFAALRGPLVELIGKIASSGRKAPVEILERKYPSALQERLAREAAQKVGFDFEAGRLDVSVHPFCSGLGPGDCRMTTRYDENYFGDAFFGVLHESGHGLYNQGLEAEHWGTPRGESISLGIHESQSRMWENLVGRSAAFWRFYFPKVKDAFGDVLRDVSEEQWVFAINDVRPSLIRTESDEATYNLHILLRFELEQAMLSGDLTVPDIPAAWNEKMKKYLGLTPPDDSKGCLQDVHWSGGAIGYFPTYTLGNLYAAQFFQQARKDLGDLDGQFARGEFSNLLNWLRQNIHRHGRRYSARELVKKVTGRDLSWEPLMAHLSTKARQLYGIAA
jgi:carboxypeptidase Taq